MLFLAIYVKVAFILFVAMLLVKFNCDLFGKESIGIKHCIIGAITWPWVLYLLINPPNRRG